MNDPTPFITSLRREADGFANTLTLVVWIVGIVFGAWMALDAWGIADHHVPNSLRVMMLVVGGAWFVFKALAILIDYAIYAVARAITEWVNGFFLAFQQDMAADSETASAATPDQRDSAVAYLHDFLKRPRQAPTDVAGPAEPTPPAAA
jgi:Na+-transporting methylmalonyl-CoA/oxaloacetate decarboxylase gamma subunit